MKCLLSIPLILGVVTSFAGTCTWQGGQFACWTNTANWVEGTVPKVTDSIYIGSDLPGECLINMDGVSTSDANKTLHDLHITSGTIVFTNGSPRLAKDVTNVIDVAQGATLKTHCTFIGYSYQSCWLWKTGGGTWRTAPYGTSWYIGDADRPFHEVCVKEGALTVPSARMYGRRYIVSDGATLSVNAISSFKGYEQIHVEKGGVVYLNSDPASRLAGLSGEGTVYLSQSSGSYDRMALNLNKGPFRFSGTIGGTPIASINFYNYKANASYPATEAERDFIIGGAQSLANFKAFYAAITPSFAAGIGEYWTACLKGSAGVPIVMEDENGEPIRLHADFDATTPTAIQGSGDWFARSASVVTGAQVSVTGLVGSDAGATLMFTNKADLSTFAGVVANGTVVYASVSNDVQEAPLTGAGTVTVNGPMCFKDVWLTGMGNLNVNAATTIEGGEFGRYTVPFGADAGLAVVGPETKLYGPAQTTALTASTYPRVKPLGVALHAESGNAASYLTVSNGAMVRISHEQDSNLPSLSLVDGGSLELLANCGWRSSGKASSYCASVDGGRICLSGDYATYGFSFPDSSVADKWTMRVGTKGARIDYTSVKTVWYAETFEWNDYLRAESGVTGAKDGGIAFAASGIFRLRRPQNVTGPIRIEDGRFIVHKDATDAATDGQALGTGDLVLAGGCLAIQDDTTNLGLKAAMAAGAKLIVEAPSRLDFGVESGSSYKVRKAAQTITAGPSGASSSSFERKTGGVLFVTDVMAPAVNGANGMLLVSGGMDCYADGRTKAPVFTLSAAPGSNGYLANFARYDAMAGIVEYAAYAQDLSGTADQVVRLKKSTGSVSIAAGETKQIAGLLTVLDSTGTFNPLSIGADGTLAIGDGVNPACILVSTGRENSQKVISGGTVDFGSSEGVVAIGERANHVYSSKPVFDTSFAGTAGMTFAGVANNVAAFMTLKRASTYTGGTTIGALSVQVENGAAFGSGAVKVCPSRMGGGQVSFLTPMTMANDFVVSGDGMPEQIRDWYAGGALVFKATGDVHLTGAVRIDGFARVSTKRGASVSTDGSGIFDGVISGGRLQLLTEAADGGAPIVLTRPNTYTGGTEVLRSKLVLRGAAPSLGTGKVLMDRSWLCFENTAALTVPNRLEGDGTVILAGTAPVSFTGDVSGFTAALDLAGTQQTLTAFPSFATSITNSSARVARLILAPNLGTVALGDRTIYGEKLDLAIGEGTLLDLGGADVTVRRCHDGAEKRVVNGTLHETKPLQGMLLIVR